MADAGPQPGPRSRAAGLTLRPVADADLDFLKELYASTRREEVAQSGWPPEQQEAFLAQQFAAQHTHYLQHYGGDAWWVIGYRGAPAGRLYLGRWAAEHRIIDIALMPDYRGRGLGEALLRDLMDEAAAAGKPLTIHVESFNPAMRLYRRLGFEVVEDKGVYQLMAWDGAQANTAS